MASEKKIAEGVATGLEYMSSGFHAIPSKDMADSGNSILSFPARHRLYNVYGMVIGFSTMKYMSDVMYGHSINGGQYKKIEEDDVPRPLRFLHGIIKCDPFSDAPKDQWLTVLHKLIPAAGGAAGAIAGSEYFFKHRKDTAIAKILKDKKEHGRLNPLQVDTLASWEQARPWRKVAGATAWFASSSGLTGLLYGTALNISFLLANGSKTPAGAAEFLHLPFLRKISNAPLANKIQLTSSSGPENAFGNMMKRTKAFLESANRDLDTTADKYGKEMASAVFSPLFRKLSLDEKDQIAGRIKEEFSNIYHNRMDAMEHEIAALVQKTPKAEKEIRDLFTKKTEEDLRTTIAGLLHETGLQEKGGGMLAGNNGWIGNLAELVDFRKKIPGIRKLTIGGPDISTDHKALKRVLAGVGAAGVTGVGIGEARRSGKISATNTEGDLSKTDAGDYVKAIDNKQNAGKGFLNGRVLDYAQWVGDSALAVIPVHRFWTATGLTLGGGLGLYVSKILRGASLANGNPIKAEQIPNGLKKIHGVLADNSKLAQKIQTRLKDSNPELANTFMRLGGLYTFAAFCAVGVMMGSKHAYRSVYQKNANPKSLEDYLARTRQHQGDKMIPFVAGSSIFGSCAGTFMVPIIPGINYGSSLAYRVVSMQDRNITTPGLKWLTGNKALSYFALREGLEYTLKYAVHNKSKNPEQLQELSYILLEPLARHTGSKLTGAQVKQFADKISEVRDKYWTENGIPEDKQDELMRELKKKFTGKGLDRTLYECGIDTLKINFQTVGGWIGKFSGFFGAKKKVEEEQSAYRKMAEEWRKEWTKEPEVAKAADKPEEAAAEPQKSFAAMHQPKQPLAPVSLMDRATADSRNFGLGA